MTDVAHHAAGQPDQRGASDGDAILNQMHRTVMRFAAVRALVGLDCPEQLRDGPRTVTDLAVRCGADASMLGRVLRTVATTGLLRTVGPGRYELTEAGQALLDGVELQRIRWNADLEIWTALGEMTEAVRTGQAPFVRRFGGLYEYLAGRPAAAEAFDMLMVARSTAVADALAKTSVFPATGTVVDVGGGRGTYLAAVLRAYPGLRGILVDLERVVDSAREFLTDNGVIDRCQVVVGDFLAAVPPGGDAYLLAQIIHNWDDAEAVRILRTVRAAISGHGRLLVAEEVLPDDDNPHPGKDLDVRLLTLHTGKERSQAEYAALFAEAGFRPGPVIELAAGSSVLTATPAE
jgi:hypothetical protein